MHGSCTVGTAMPWLFPFAQGGRIWKVIVTLTVLCGDKQLVQNNNYH